MKKQSNDAFIWIISLVIAIPLFIALAALNFILAALDKMAVNKPVNLV
ncbi:hypothetical protein Q9L42_004435 [Methylomarinum sp. Ch1-1]|uniref:Uncharacterized protein n=1 Tax=Methylomarinum roseum TaxID=3067653 RepID=A0AAU7NWQ9_9GAMM|nr:hypothetical protein [Methylomarinum sp. Ch1-1]MDP4522558.1 hypothetical protein [Methylomarinum sp. Ch1-1]